MRIEKCYFCSGSVYPGHGTVFVRNDASVFRFCRSKCQRSFKLKRNPRRTAWTKSFRKIRQKELSADPVLAFERRVAEPVAYDRDVYAQVLRGLPRIMEIREARERFFIKNRILSAQEQTVGRERVLLQKSVGVLEEPQRAKRAAEEKARIAARISAARGSAQ